MPHPRGLSELWRSGLFPPYMSYVHNVLLCKGYRRKVLCRLNWLWTDLRVLTNVWQPLSVPVSARVIYYSSRAGCCNCDATVLSQILLVFVLARNKVYLEVRECYNRQLPPLEFGNGFNTFVQQLACCRFCVMQSLAFLLPRQQAGSLALLPSTVHLRLSDT